MKFGDFSYSSPHAKRRTVRSYRCHRAKLQQACGAQAATFLAGEKPMGTKGRWLASALGACAIAAAHGAPSARAEIATYGRTATPIKHVVVIFQENVSFDHYFATYPHADNRDGEPTFWAASNTPSVNGLTAGCSAQIQTDLTRSGSISAKQRPATKIMITRPSNRPSTQA
jgi:phospholipase C